MVVRQAPPGRTSSANSGTVKPLGPHHFASCSALVSARNTRSRGASKRREILSASVSSDLALTVAIADSSVGI